VIPTTNASVIMSSVRRHLHDEALSGGKVSLPPSKNREEEREEGGGGGMVVAGCHGEERKSNEVNWEAARLSFLLGHPRQFRHHGCYSSAHRFQSSC
jgi:hypothetical protein